MALLLCGHPSEVVDGEATELVESMLPELVVLTGGKLGELLDACPEPVCALAED